MSHSFCNFNAGKKNSCFKTCQETYSSSIAWLRKLGKVFDSTPVVPKLLWSAEQTLGITVLHIHVTQKSSFCFDFVSKAHVTHDIFAHNIAI